MTVATFGELLHSANAHIDAAARFPDVSLTAGSVTAATRQACRVVTAMSHYLDDAVPRSEYGRAVRSGMEPWMRAAVDTRGALKMAAENLSRGAGDAGGLRGPCATAADPLAAHLAGAAGALAAGRDLLDTHFVISADRTRSAHSDWSAVVASAPVARALLGEIVGWSRQLAILAGRLTLAAAADPAVGVPLREGLASARRWLLVAGAAVQAGLRDHPVPALDVALLHAIPAGAIPARRAPGEAEPLVELCEGIAVSASRLRAIAHRTAGQAALPLNATAASWRWNAKAAAVICHVSEMALRRLADRAGHTTGEEAGGAQLDSAAEAVAHVGACWRQAAAAWNLITTETHGLNGPGVSDTGDLLIRLGRLVSGDPLWTPSRSQRARLRDLAGLPPDPATAALVVAAVHRAADTLACTGAADLQAVNTASMAGRLYMPTRSLPERHDVPRRFGNAVPEAVAPLLHAYREAAGASVQAARALDAVALTLGAPSRILAAARAAADPAQGTSAPWPAGGKPAYFARTPSDPRNARGKWLPGPVERAVQRELDAPDPVLLLHAAAIDRAAKELIAEAKEVSDQCRATSQAEDATGTSRPERSASRIAAESFPQTPVSSAAGPQVDSGPSHGMAPGVQRDPAAQGRRCPR